MSWILKDSKFNHCSLKKTDIVLCSNVVELQGLHRFNTIVTLSRRSILEHMANNMRYVGTLQDFGVPYSSLYVDTEKRLLYLLVRVSSPRDTLNEYGR